jgi:hypothetical protein
MPTDILDFVLGFTACSITSNTAELIECVLAYPLMAGSWKPQIRDINGLFPLAVALGAHDVPLVVSSIFPLSGYNPAGYETVTIAGSGFPSILNSLVSLKFNDGTRCDLFATTATEMKCRTKKFDAAFVPDRRELSTLGTIATEGRTMTFDFLVDPFASAIEDAFTELTTFTGLTLDSNPPAKVESIAPDSFSPILTKELVI